MLKVAITGNIGTGKSTVCRIFESLGIKVYYADPEARKFYQHDAVRNAVKKLFGSKVYDQNGQLITSELAGLVFGDDTRLRQLNAIIHPLVLEDFLAWAAGHENEKYILYESALLFESGFYRHFDQSILVTSPAELAMKRVMERDGLTADEFMTRRARQMPQEEKIPMADHIIANSEDRLLIPQVIALHDKFVLLTS